MKYIYTAVFTPRTGESGTYFEARVPDLPGCITTGSSLQDAITQITDAASLWLVVAEDDTAPIHPASDQDRVPHADGDYLSLISVDTIKYRSLTDTKAVRKNVSLPSWMASLADRRGINCSQVLQERLSDILNAG